MRSPITLAMISICIHNNNCNVIVGVFVCFVYFIMSVYLPPVTSFLFISYVISRWALDDAQRSTRAPRCPGWETLLYSIIFFVIVLFVVVFLLLYLFIFLSVHAFITEPSPFSSAYPVTTLSTSIIYQIHFTLLYYFIYIS